MIKLPSFKQVENSIKIDDEARKIVQVAITEFICFITSDIIDELKD